MYCQSRNFWPQGLRAYESELMKARIAAHKILHKEATELGAHAIVGISIDYEILGKESGMMMVCISGTAVTLSS